MFKKILYPTVAIAVFMMLAACSARGKKIDSHHFVTDISGLILDDSKAPTILYLRPNWRGFATYNSFIIEPVRISYRDPKMKKIDAEDLARMQDYFRERLVGELKDAGYGITSDAGAETMRISFTLSGIKAPNPLPNIIALQVPIVLSVGEVTVEAAFSESITNRIDAVAVHRAQGSRILNPTPWSTWADIESSFDQWAKGIAKAVKKEHQDK